MKREFISTSGFDKAWALMGLGDDELRTLENEILRNPQIGDVIAGSGGLRKMRFSVGERGKRGGARVLYVDFIMHDKVYLITAYPKNVMENVTKEDLKLFKNLIYKTKKDLGGN